MKKKLVVFSGAGISAESGVQTFRDSNGLWENHRVEDVASPQGFAKNPNMVLDFYNARRRQLREITPNKAHFILAELEEYLDVQVITQNVDDLHERAGSQNVLHLHGELLKVRSTRNESYVLDWRGDLQLGDCDANGNQLRPHIVWFGEVVPALEAAIDLVEQADYIAIIGTSLQVYPAAGLTDFAPKNIPIFYIDPKATSISNLKNPLTCIPMKATAGILVLQQKLMELEKKTKS